MLSDEMNNGELHSDWSPVVRLHRDWSRIRLSHLIRLVHSIAAGERVSGENGCERYAYLTPARGRERETVRRAQLVACGLVNLHISDFLPKHAYKDRND